MQFVYHLDHNYKITLNAAAESTFELSVTADNRRVYGGTFNTSIAVDEPKDFEKLMTKFFEGRYIFLIERYSSKELLLSFKIVIDSITLKKFELLLQERILCEKCRCELN